jgi:long-chain acyl-CoA synthetase
MLVLQVPSMLHLTCCAACCNSCGAAAMPCRSPLVLQVFVHGDSLQRQPVAVAVPDPEALKHWAVQHNLPQDLQDFSRLWAEPRAVQAVHESLLQQAAAAELQGYETVAGVVLVPEPFSVENGLLTPTQKLRRQVARQRFAAAIQAVYSSLTGSGSQI